MSYLQDMIDDANNGDIQAMMDLGVAYRFGYHGATRDLDEAMKWFGMAAKMQHPEAYCYMGYALEIPVGYLDPNDDEEDYKRAFGYFVKGALLGDPNSLYKIGDMYYSGKYVEADSDFARALYQKCLELIDDEVEAYIYPGLCLRIGECYYKGIGNERDLNEAARYFTYAIREYETRLEYEENPEFMMASYNRARFLLKRAKSGKLVEQSTTNGKPRDIADGTERDSLCCVKKVLPDLEKDTDALARVIEMYREGLFVEKDEAFAEHLEQRSKANAEGG